MGDMIVTKREILLSIAIVCIMLLFGVLIAGSINDAVMTKHQEYNTALQISEDKEIFEYGMRTDVGNAFVYGELKAVDPVGYEEIEGEYSYIKKVKEKYTRHSRTVTKSDGKRTWTETEYYWTWDKVSEWSKHSTKITFLGVEFDYGTINFPGSYKLNTIKESDKIRYVYYGATAQCVGTLYTELKNDTISGGSFHANRTIDETIKSLESNWEIILFWVGWVLLTGGVVVGFYFIDNKWLEDKRPHDCKCHMGGQRQRRKF